jgi:predicted NUDIX family phosphoesterase
MGRIARGDIDRSCRMAQNEQVLVVERKVVEREGMFHGLMFDVDRYLRRLFVQGVPRFMLRSQAETDPTHKQIIPYVIMMHQGQVLSYVRGRRAGETRLVGNRSIGIGGHINPSDDLPLFNADFRQTYLAAVAREVAEEIVVDTGYTDRIVALLNDDSNPVGQVHLGVVHCWTLEAPKVARREQMITQLAFLSLAELHAVRDSMETWSQLCLDGLDEMAKRLKSEPA